MQTLDYLMIAAGYFSGSIPIGLIIFYFLKKDDVRKHGSKNIGATNVARSAGIIPGIITLILDIMKGFLPVAVCGWYSLYNNEWTVAFVAVAAVLGHMFPIWLLFKGGKGVATALGVFLALNWIVTLCTMVIFIISFLTSKIVSLSSLIASGAFVILSFTLGSLLGMTINLQIGALVCGIFIFIKHQENIKRLIAGSEKKLSTKRAKGNEEES